MLRITSILAVACLISLPAHAQYVTTNGDRAALSDAQPAPSRLQTEPSVQTAGPLVSPDFRGSLDDNDPRREGGHPYEEHSFRVDAGHDITVTMTADGFDTYLIVRAPGGQKWENDDFNGTRMSQVQFAAAESGMYTIWATAYSTDGRGDYEVRVSAKAATILSTVSGRLDYQDQQQIKGEYYDTITIRPPTSGTFYVELLPLGFSGYVRVTSPGGVHFTSEAHGTDQRSMRVGPMQGQSGEWIVDITTQGADQVGAYDLRIVRLDEQ